MSLAACGERMGQQCPICDCEVAPDPRYPRYVCRACVQRAASAEGALLEFTQSSPEGAYAAHYAKSGEAYSSHECWIDGIKCWADEARFGGIVVQAL